MLHIALCDDEPKFIRELQSHIQHYAEESGIKIRVSIYSDGAELTQNYPTDIDLIFLDIQMEHMNGLSAAEDIRRMDAEVSIIFLTSMAQYALEGYRYNATNYIIKPIQYVRLKAELDRWLARYHRANQEHLLISNDSGKYKVYLNTLMYIETYGRNLMLHTDSGDILSHKKMKDYEADLLPHGFVRCHTSFLVNLFYVKRAAGLTIELVNGTHIPISQARRKQFMLLLTEYMGAQI